jgi:FkbM family methyltransferase
MLFFPPSLDLKYTLIAMKKLARYPSALPSLFGGADALNRLLVDLYARNPVPLVHTHGFDIWLDSQDMGVSPSIGVLGWHEMKTTELFIKLIRRGSTVIDVGANIGFFTLLAAKLVGKKGLVISFEPEPASFSLLTRSVERNNFNNVRLFQKCISNVDGQQLLHLSVTHNKGLHSIARDLGGPSVLVQSARLDTLASSDGIGSIDLLKIDVEGAEPQVLEGAERLISESRVRNIIMEWEHPETWARRNDILEMIFSKFDVYEFVRSLPFHPARKLTSDSTDLFGRSVGTNLYLRRRPRFPNEQ